MGNGVCDISGLLTDTPELVESIAVVSCACDQSRDVRHSDRGGAVVLAALGHDRLSKLAWLLRLRYRVWQARRTLARQGLPEASVLAVWPTLYRSMIVYDVGTSAARYAESRVLPGGHGALGGLVRAAAGVHMSIDVVVVLGIRPDIESRRRSAGGD